MENATKALLIAAAVLIAIVLIALGVNLLSAGGDTADQAGQVGEELDKGIGSAAGKVEGGLASLGGGRKLSKSEANAYWSGIGKNSLPTFADSVTLKVYKYLGGSVDKATWNSKNVNEQMINMGTVKKVDNNITASEVKILANETFIPAFSTKNSNGEITELHIYVYCVED